MTASNRWISDLHWRRTVQQDRSSRTQNALLEAAEALLLEKGADAVTIAEIADRAEVSVGAFYHHFRDKKALLLVMFERMTQHFATVAKQAVDPARWEGAGVADILRGYVEFSLASASNGPMFKNAAMLVAADNPALLRDYTETMRAMLDSVRELVLARSDEIGHTCPHTAITFVLDQLSGMLWARHDQFLHSSQLAKPSDSEFTEEALKLVFQYLELESSPPGSGVCNEH